MAMSDFAWAALDQLARGPVHDGDLVSKTGRTELMEQGFARRHRPPASMLALNELTPSGKELAARYHHRQTRGLGC